MKAESLYDHLAELRSRIIKCFWIVLVATFVAFHFAEPIFDFIRKPIEPYLPQGGLIYTGPIDKFMAYVKLAIATGIVVACPFWIYQAWKFVAPGLYKHEKRYAVGFVASGTFMFLLGVTFSYLIVLPMAFGFLMTFGGEADKPMIAIDSYLSFVTHITLMFGFSFELPVVLTTLGLLGVISKKFLQTYRRYAIVGIATVCAIVTPPDLASMVLMLAPMWILYELSVVLVGFFEKKRMEDTASFDIESES